MADWPRWLEENVDSQAMLSAFQRYLHTSNATVGPLPIIIHRNSEALCVGLEAPPAPPGTFCVTCQVPSCERCRRGWGGFRFKWYSWRWWDRYRQLVRPGAWGSDEPTSHTVQPRFSWRTILGPHDSPLGCHLGYDAFATSSEPYDGLTHAIEIEEPVGSPLPETEDGIVVDTRGSIGTPLHQMDSSDEHASPVWTYQMRLLRRRMERTKEVCFVTSPDQHEVPQEGCKKICLGLARDNPSGHPSACSSAPHQPGPSRLTEGPTGTHLVPDTGVDKEIINSLALPQKTQWPPTSDTSTSNESPAASPPSKSVPSGNKVP